MVSAEYSPFAKTGGLADMVTGLSKYLVAAGHDVRVVLPLYGALKLDPRDRLPEKLFTLGDLEISPVALDGAHPGYHLREVPSPAGSGPGGSDPRLYLLDSPPFFGSESIYGGGELEARRFALLAHGALRLCSVLDWAPQVIHCHDWHAALLPRLLKTNFAALRLFRETSSVLTIHNIGYQGVFSGTLAPELGLLPGPPASSPGPASGPQFPARWHSRCRCPDHRQPESCGGNPDARVREGP